MRTSAYRKFFQIPKPQSGLGGRWREQNYQQTLQSNFHKELKHYQRIEISLQCTGANIHTYTYRLFEVDDSGHEFSSGFPKAPSFDIDLVYCSFEEYYCVLCKNTFDAYTVRNTDRVRTAEKTPRTLVDDHPVCAKYIIVFDVVLCMCVVYE